MSKCCLLTMAKNEEATIVRCLDSALPHVAAVCYVDTGSTDGTEDVVALRLAQDGRVGVLFKMDTLPWNGFGPTRSMSLEIARGLAFQSGCDWILFLDADDTLEVEPGFQWPEPGKADAYQIRVKRPPEAVQQEHAQVLLFSAHKPWRYEGLTHEFPVCEGASVDGPLAGISMVYRCDGARNRSGRRNHEDADLLEQAMAEEPANPRWVHYAAQSHRDAGNLERALELYLQRAGMGGWDQEQFVAVLEAAKLTERLGKPIDSVVFAYLAAHQLRPHRAESLGHLSRYLRGQGWAEFADVLDGAWKRMPSTGDVLGVESWSGGSRLRAESVSIGIISYPRKPYPLPVTVTSCIAADPLAAPEAIRVFHDGLNPAVPPGVAFTARTQDELDGFDADPAGCRYMACDNMARLFEWGAERSSVVVELEDDVMFTRLWLSKALKLLATAEASSKAPVVISLHDMFNAARLDQFHCDSGLQAWGYRLLDVRPGAATNGAQGHLMRASTARAIAGRLREMIRGLGWEQRKWLPPDIAMIRACREIGARFLLSDPSLLLHQSGTESTWFAKDSPGGGFDRSLAVTRNFRPW